MRLALIISFYGTFATTFNKKIDIFMNFRHRPILSFKIGFILLLSINMKHIFFLSTMRKTVNMIVQVEH
jgi:hypothetical protein